MKLRGREDELKHSGRGREYIPSWSVGCHVTEISTGWVCRESGVSNGSKTTVVNMQDQTMEKMREEVRNKFDSLAASP